MATKQEIFQEKLQEYLASSREGKGEILDSVCRVSGVHRKAAIRRFKTLQLRSRSWHERRGRTPTYDQRVTAALKDIWEAANRICAERIHPIAPEYVRVLKRDGMWKHGEDTTRLFLAASLGTLKNRIATFENIKRRGGRGTTNHRT